jgi:hypothetical protein
MRRAIAPALVLATALVLPLAAQALRIEAIVTPLGGGGFHYDVSVLNDETVDVVLATIVDAPLADATLAATLVAPPGHQASYDPGFGFVDFIEDVTPFLPGTTTPGFSFDSAAGPGPGVFESFQGLTATGTLLSGTVDVTLVPEAGTAPLLALGLALIGAVRPRARRSGDG